MSKQSKADKAFVAKIATIGLVIGGKHHDCPDCGKGMQQVGIAVGMKGVIPVVTAPIYANGPLPPAMFTSRRGRPQKDADDLAVSA